MPIDDGIMARIRRSGIAGPTAQSTQEVDDQRARGYSDADIRRTQYERMKEQELHNMADRSHAVHRDSTGQVPDND